MTYTLRELPLPVKVVASVFLMAVGAGYLSAMVQLHMKDSKSGSGKPMPTVDDVVIKYTGKKKYDPNAPPPVSKFVQLVSAPRSAPWGANSSMVAAFFEKDGGDWDDAAGDAAQLPHLTAEREGERAVAEAWGRADAGVRKTAYDANAFKIESGAPAKITSQFQNPDGTYKVKTLIDTRCARCHKKGGSYSSAPLQSYADIDKFLKAPEAKKPQNGSPWVNAATPISVESLTQSTHAHLLSFAVLFSLTGLVFAMSSYPTGLRCVLGPWVVIAVFADVSLWWLARLCDQWGPYFAMGIIATGGLAGAGLFGQIVLSLFNMYGRTGKFVIGGFFVAGAVIAGLVWINKIDPALSQKAPTPDVKEPPEPGPKDGPKPPPDKKDDKKGTEPPPMKLSDAQLKELRDAWDGLSSTDAAKQLAARQKCDQLLGEPKRKEIEELLKNAKSEDKATRDAALAKLAEMKTAWGFAPVVPVVHAAPSKMENLLTFPIKGPDGKVLSMEETPWAGGDDGNMSRAFYDKDKAFKDFMAGNNPQAAKDKLMAERDGERVALIAWIRGSDAPRKAAYDADSFQLPPDLAGKPITPKYVKGDKVSVKTIIADRCLRCHGPEGKQFDDYPLDTYEHWKKYMTPPAPAVPEVPPKAPDAAPAPKPVNPIPDAKDD